MLVSSNEASSSRNPPRIRLFDALACVHRMGKSRERCRNPFHRSLSSAKVAPACLRRSHSIRGFQSLMSEILASTKKPIIGVGESTTGTIPFFLHTNLEIEPRRFHRAVCPTWKVGLRFERWGNDATNSFNFAFDKQILRRDVRLSQRLGVYYGALGQDLALSSALIRRNKSPVFRDPVTGEHRFHPYGYHIENQRFTAFLGTVAQREESGFTMASYGEFSPTVPGPSALSRLTLEKAIPRTCLSIAPGFRRCFSSIWV